MVVVSLWLALGVTVARADTLGTTSVGSSTAGLAVNLKRANVYSLAVPASVLKLSVYLAPSGTSGSEELEGVIYRDHNGAPGGLVAQSTPLTFTSSDTAGWYDLDLTSAVTLPPGSYWLGLFTGGTSGVAEYAYTSASSDVRDGNAQTYEAGGASNPFGAVGFSDQYVMSLYATYATPVSQAGFRGGFESRTICPRVRRTSSDAKRTEVPKGVDRSWCAAGDRVGPAGPARGG